MLEDTGLNLVQMWSKIIYWIKNLFKKMNKNDFEVKVDEEIVTKIFIDDLIVLNYTDDNKNKRSGMLLNLGDMVFRKAIENYEKEKIC